jgi:hypothetical protein
MPWTQAFAQAPTPIRDSVRQMSLQAAQPQEQEQERPRQSVARTTESKLLLGLLTGGLIVGGATMMAYGSTATCKGKEAASTGGCDRTALVGAMTFSGGAAMALLWALSRD